MFLRILGIIVPVFSVVALGWLYGRRAKPDMAWVNRISMNVLAPALIFSILSSKDFDLYAYGPLIAGAAGVVLGSGVLAWPFVRVLRIDYRTFLPPMMFNNCGNMGLPLAALAFGPQGLAAMVAVFTVSNLLQFTLGTWMVDHHARFGKLARNPMVLATFAGFLYAALHPPLPEVAAVTLKLVGDATIPMMLLSLGVRLNSIAWKETQIGILGAIVGPLSGIAMAALLSPLLDLDRTQQGLLILFGSLPPAVFNFMVAEEFNQEPAKVASIVMIGNLMALAFVPIGLTFALG